jgi:hypothetical protein
MTTRQVRAPKEDGAVVAEPPLADVGRLASDNARRRLQTPPILGRPWSEITALTFRTLDEANYAYQRRVDGTPYVWTGCRGSVFMAGHQPELFHPGVWVKNFALHGLARQYGGVSVNLIVDNDNVKTTALHFPVLREPLPLVSEFQPYRATEPFDHPPGGEPYEEYAIRDEALFASLPERVRPRWGFEPLLHEYWKVAVEAGRRTRLLGDRLAAARRALERRWGCYSYEVPVSAVCQTEPFAWFACDLLTNLPRFHAAYNDSVRDYRTRYGLRSTSHPVPDLATEGDWLEAPFWAWRSGDARRGRLMVRLTPQTVDLRVGGDHWPWLPREPEAMVRAFLDLGKQGLKVRSRALTNTMYARLFLCDLFIHGIGGGKYDEVNDAIIRRYYGHEPPAYLVLSATLLLPLPHYPATPDDGRRLKRRARDVYYNPQDHLDDSALSQPTVAALAARKEALIHQEPTNRRGRRERFRQIREVNDSLRASVEGELAELRRAEAGCEAEVQANAILQRRDYPFILYPEKTLRPFCEQFLTPDALAQQRCGRVS